MIDLYYANLKRWFEAIRNRPATISAYAQAEPYSNQPAVTEEGKKLLFGQTAASIRALSQPAGR
jgi:GST-like protein